MVSAAADAPISASISTPVLWCTATLHTILTVPRGPSAMSTLQRSSASGWQNGMISWVFLAAMTPATMAVSNTGPFLVRWPRSESSRATAGGSLTMASADASRKVAALAPTSTMVGRLAASMCVSRFATSAADVVHLDLVQVGGVAQRGAQLAVAVAPAAPNAAHQFEEFIVAGAGAQRRAQVGALRREQAGIEGAVGRYARARAIAAKRLRHRRDEA